MTMTKRGPGRPPGNLVLRILRANTWLYAVQAREKLTNCSLDVKFATPENEPKRTTADRIKAFEAIKSYGSTPGNGTNTKRKFDLIARVESDIHYKGTAAVFHSPFWKLMESKQMALSDIRELIVECIVRLGLAKEKGNYQDDGRNDLVDLITNDPEISIEEYFRLEELGDAGYDEAMASAFLMEPNLDLIAFIGALAFEAIEAGKMHFAKYQIDCFDKLLSEYSAKLGSIGEELHQYATNRMNEAWNADALKGLPDYSTMLSKIQGVNLQSAASALLIRHERLLWRK